MARRNKASDLLFGAVVVVVVIGALIAGIVKFFENVGVVVPAVITAIGISIYLWTKHAKKKAQQRQLEVRRAELLEKYKDKTVVDSILAKRIWVGQLREQLIDSLGQPHDIDQKVLKTKKRELWKYDHKGGNRYMYRITLENDVVVGWEEKA